MITSVAEPKSRQFLPIGTHLSVLSGLDVDCSSEGFQRIELHSSRYYLYLHDIEYRLPIPKREAQTLVQNEMPGLAPEFLDLISTMLAHPCWNMEY